MPKNTLPTLENQKSTKFSMYFAYFKFEKIKGLLMTPYHVIELLTKQ